jgi:hypothetical protein
VQIRDRIKELRRVKASELRPSPRNWRTHPAAQQDALRAVLAEIGYADALLARELPDTSLELIDGHLRAETTPDSLVPVLVLDVDEAEAAKLLATLDPLAAMATADADKLDALLREVGTESEPLAAMLAGLAEANGILGGNGEVPADAEPQIDRADELRREWGVEPGQLWRLGDHRLLCGDSTKAEDVARVMRGEKAQLCLTDPPYGVDWNYDGADDTRENLLQLIAGFLPLARESADVVLLTPGIARQRLYPEWDWCLCWFVAAGAHCNPWGFTCWQPVLAYGKDPYLARGMGSRPDAVSLTESAPDLSHPCPKPLGVWTWFLQRGSVAEGDVVYDPFLGSGTTLIACESLGRRCRAVEISPGYVAVALQRFLDATGRRPARG